MTPSQQRALALLPKVTGGFSLVFSAFLAVHVLRDSAKRQLCYQRLMLAVSIVDMSASLWMSLSTWPFPQTQEESMWAVGNETTCRVQGFFVQCSIMSSFYHASLSIYFWLVIVRGWNEERLHRVEWLLHGIPLCWGLGTALVGLFLDAYDAAVLWCWISSEWQSLRWSCYYLPLWIMISVVTLCCLAILLHVRGLELQVDEHGAAALDRSLHTIKEEDLEYEEMVVAYPSSINLTTEQSTDSVDYSIVSVYRQSRRIKQVAQQCFLFAGAFYINWAALTAVRLIQALDGDVPFGLIVIAAITVPIQGLPNFLVYLRPKVMRARRLHPHVRWFKRWFEANNSSSLFTVSRRQAQVLEDSEISGASEELDCQHSPKKSNDLRRSETE